MTLLNSNVRSNRLGAALLVAGLLLANAYPAFGQQVEQLSLTVGKSIVLDYPSDIRQISTSDPAVVDALAVTTREMLLHAKGNGSATIIVWSKTGQRSIYSITVEQNLEPLRKLLKETFPNEDIQIQSTRDSLSLTGHVSSKDVGDRALALVSSVAKSIVNNLQIAAAPIEKQIMLRVKFAELDRTAIAQFGVNLVSTGAANTVGSVGTGEFPSPVTVRDTQGRTTFSVTDALNIFAFRPDLNLASFIRALQQQSILQILAEQNLVTTNGKEASFLVGGEFPIPVLQGGGNAGAVTIQFREFGIRLAFNPLITENGTIKMYIKPEVSTIDTGNGVNISGFFIPALSTRRIESNIELAQGQSFVIGGLLDERVTETMAKIPGLANIPLLGAIFKSRENKKNRTELIVVVTPEITRPLNPGEPLPLPTMPREFMQPMIKPTSLPKNPNDHGDKNDKSDKKEKSRLAKAKKAKAQDEITDGSH